MDEGAQLSDGDEFVRNAETTTTLSGGLALRKPSHRKYRRKTLSRSPSPRRSAGRGEDSKLRVEKKNRTGHSSESSPDQTLRENADGKRRANDMVIRSGDRVVASGDLGAVSKIVSTPESTPAGKNGVDRNAEMKDNHGLDNSGHGVSICRRRDEYVEEKSGNGRGDRRGQGRDEIGGREKDRGGLDGRRDKGGSRYSGYHGGRNSSRRDDNYGRDRGNSRGSSRDYRDSGRDYRDSGKDYKGRESRRDHHDSGRDYRERGRNSRDSGRGVRAIHGDYDNRRRVEGGRDTYRQDDSRYSRDRLQHREKYVDKVPSRDESRDRSNSRDGNRKGNRETSGASPVLRDASGKDADSFEGYEKDRRDSGDVSTDKDDGDDEENRDLHEEKNLGQDRIRLNSSFPAMADNDSVDQRNKRRASGGDALGDIEDASLQSQKANSTEVENSRKRKGTAFEKSSQAQDRGLLEDAEAEKETALADHRMTEVDAPTETTPDQTLMTMSAPVSDLTRPQDVLSQGTSQQENPVVSQRTDADSEAKARAAKAAIRASKWGPPANHLPQAVLPRVVPPQVAFPRPVLPQAVLPQAVLPRAVPPQVVLPQLVTPQAVPPQGLLPLPSQNCGVIPQIAALLAARKAAELVNASMGVPGSMSADDKKRLLWGSKKAAVVEEPSAAVGTNRWDTAHFADREREEKFQKLMGVKTEKTACEGAKSEPSNGGTAVSETTAAALTEEKQREIQEELEKQFSVGLRRRDGRTVGLGL